MLASRRELWLIKLALRGRRTSLERSGIHKLRVGVRDSVDINCQYGWSCVVYLYIIAIWGLGYKVIGVQSNWSTSSTQNLTRFSSDHFNPNMQQCSDLSSPSTISLIYRLWYYLPTGDLFVCPVMWIHSNWQLYLITSSSCVHGHIADLIVSKSSCLGVVAGGLR